MFKPILEKVNRKYLEEKIYRKNMQKILTSSQLIMSSKRQGVKENTLI